MILLTLLCAASAATMIVLGSRLTFFNDDWVYLLRPGFGADALLEPHNGHLSIFQILAYKGLASAFGLEAQAPFRAVLAVTVVATGIAVFLYVRRRLGDLLALIAAAVILFLGPAWDAFLLSANLGLNGSLATGLFALLALERPGRRAELAACVLLVASICFSGAGVSFLVAAAVAVALQRRLSDGWVVGVPAAIFAAWWIVWGQDSSFFSWLNVARSPAYVFDAVSAGLASVTGLGNTIGEFDALTWGRPLLVGVLVLMAALLHRGWRPPLGALPIAAGAFSFWILLAFNYYELFGRSPDATRFLLISATFLILIAAELARGVRLQPATVLVIALSGLIAIGSNLAAYRQGYHQFRDFDKVTKGVLTAFDIGRENFNRELTGCVVTTLMCAVQADDYYRERDEHGSPAYSTAELTRATPEAREAADAMLASGYELGLEPRHRSFVAGLDCATLKPRFDAGSRQVPIPPGGSALLTGPDPVILSLRRFADSPSIEMGTLAARRAAVLRISVDDVNRPWRLVLSGGYALRVCKLEVSGRGLG